MPRYGAIDIGSNSIRMQAAEAIPGQSTQILAEDRQVTRLGQGVFRNSEIDVASMRQSCEVMARMAATLRSLEVAGTRAVATAAVRDAQNQEIFLERATEALGFPVEVISGQEEARLIHLGVHSRWPDTDGQTLIIDIGGGSAEVIHAERGKLTGAVSKPLGAVRLTELFLQNDPPERDQLRRMEDYIRDKLDSSEDLTDSSLPTRTVGTAATSAAVASAIHKIPRTKRQFADRVRVTRGQVRELFDALSPMPLEKRRQMVGVGPRRAEVIVAGTGVLAVIMEEFSLADIYYSSAGLRDGVIADLVERGVGQELLRLDPDRHRAVREMAKRFGVPLRHSDKVAALGHMLFESLQMVHGLPPQYGRLLEAAAYLHDIGHFVSDTRHHKHSHYLVANAELPGFTDRERHFIANLCRYHRKAMPAARHENLNDLNEEERRALVQLIPLLRLADGLDRSRQQKVRDLRVVANNGQVELKIEPAESTDLEEWAAQRAGEVFEQVYRKPLVVSRGQGGES